MELTTGNVFINEDDLIHAFVKASTEIDTYVKGYHVYKHIEANCEPGIGNRNGA